jgi:hypothetical protein
MEPLRPAGVGTLGIVDFFAGAGAFTQARPILLLLTFLVWVGVLGAGVLAQIYRYRTVATSMQQQQTKWVVLGFALAIPGLGVWRSCHMLRR